MRTCHLLLGSGQRRRSTKPRAAFAERASLSPEVPTRASDSSHLKRSVRPACRRGSITSPLPSRDPYHGPRGKHGPPLPHPRIAMDLQEVAAVRGGAEALLPTPRMRLWAAREAPVSLPAAGRSGQHPCRRLAPGRRSPVRGEALPCRRRTLPPCLQRVPTGASLSLAAQPSQSRGC